MFLGCKSDREKTPNYRLLQKLDVNLIHCIALKAYNQSISSSGQEEKFQERMNKKEHELQSLQTKLMDLQAQVEKEGVQELHYTISQLESKVEQYSQRNRELQQSLINLEAGASVPQTLQVNTQLMQSLSSFMQGRKQRFIS